ncbi:MAG: DUF2087 domain-containing protein [Chloroflexi bacterium]|nr:DUF2087 domain-containing protein [Chloroflexota bacterium]
MRPSPIDRPYHEDYATLRRELVDMHYLDRKNGVYWCVGSAGTPPPAAQAGCRISGAASLRRSTAPRSNTRNA